MKRLPLDYAVRNLGRSPVRLGLSVAGAMLVVLLVLIAGAFVRGMSRSLAISGGEGNVVLMGAGSEESMERSEITPNAPGLIAGQISGIRNSLGVPHVSPEVHMQTSIKLDDKDTQQRQVLVRGMTPPAFLVHSRVRVISGRAPEQGRDEVLVGSRAAARLGVPESRLTVGQTLYFDDRVWTISGVFESPGSVMESEIWAPLTDLQIAARRDNLSSVAITLDTAEFADVDAFAKQRLDLELIAMRERDYYSKLSNFFTPIRVMVWATAALIALGGILGGLNTMYAAFASRVREIGTLQSLGFSRSAILLSLVQESTLAACAGAVLASVLGLLLLDGLTVQFSMGAFGLILDTGVLLTGLLCGLALGLIGAIPAAVRCLRMPITEALKAA